MTVESDGETSGKDEGRIGFMVSSTRLKQVRGSAARRAIRQAERGKRKAERRSTTR